MHISWHSLKVEEEEGSRSTENFEHELRVMVDSLLTRIQRIEATVAEQQNIQRIEAAMVEQHNITDKLLAQMEVQISKEEDHNRCLQLAPCPEPGGDFEQRVVSHAVGEACTSFRSELSWLEQEVVRLDGKAAEGAIRVAELERRFEEHARLRDSEQLDTFPIQRDFDAAPCVTADRFQHMQELRVQMDTFWSHLEKQSSQIAVLSRHIAASRRSHVPHETHPNCFARDSFGSYNSQWPVAADKDCADLAERTSEAR